MTTAPTAVRANGASVAVAHDTDAHDTAVRVLVIDDHPLVREGLEGIIDGHSACRVVGSADSVETAVALDLDRVDVCTLDLSLPGISGIEGITALRSRWPSARVLIVTMYPESSHAASCLQRGAAGFVSKGASPDVIRTAVTRVAGGDKYFSADSLVVGASHTGGSPVLSSRELEVLRLLADGARITDIATRLGLSIKTASAHKMRLQRKLGASNTAQIVVIARERGVLP